MAGAIGVAAAIAIVSASPGDSLTGYRSVFTAFAVSLGFALAVVALLYERGEQTGELATA